MMSLNSWKINMGYMAKIPFSIIKLIEKFRGYFSIIGSNYPLASEDSELNPFFIVGCGRSGNTLLRAMLNVSDELVIPPESYILPRITRKFIAYNYLPWPELSSIIITEFSTFQEFYTWETPLEPVYKKARELSKQQQNLANLINLIFEEYCLYRNLDNRRWGDKTPKNAEFLPYLYNVFPSSQYIHLIRDPRAVFLSYMDSELGSKDIGKKRKTIVEFWLNSHRQIEYSKNKFGSEKFITVHYENLVIKPEKYLKLICLFLNVVYKDEMLEYWTQSCLGDVNYYSHHANVLKPLDASNIHRWKSELSKQDLDFVESKCLPYYQKLTDKYQS